MNIAREFVGGPFDAELLAVREEMCSVRVPLPKHWRKNRGIEEAAAYRLDGDAMRFVSRDAAPISAPGPASIPDPASRPITDPLLADSYV